MEGKMGLCLVLEVGSESMSLNEIDGTALSVASLDELQ